MWTDSDRLPEDKRFAVWLQKRYSLYRYRLTNCPIADSLRLPILNHPGMFTWPPTNDAFHFQTVPRASKDFTYKVKIRKDGLRSGNAFIVKENWP